MTCVYCGQNAEHQDHVFPLSKAAKLDLTDKRTRHILRKGLYIVPSCASCNITAGDHPFFSILEKRHFIQKKLASKHKKKIRTVMWDVEEIAELGYTMKREVLKMLNNRYIMEKRIAHPRTPNFPNELVEMFKHTSRLKK